MKQLFLAYNENFEVTNAQMFESENTIDFVEHNFVKPKVKPGTKEIYESATPEEIQAIQTQQRLQQMQTFLINKKADGEAYYNEIELTLTLLLAGLPLQELVPVNNEIETKIKPLINEVKMGDWFNAYMRLWITQDYTTPDSPLLQDTFYEIKNKVKQYFENNYPR